MSLSAVLWSGFLRPGPGRAACTEGSVRRLIAAQSAIVRSQTLAAQTLAARAFTRTRTPCLSVRPRTLLASRLSRVPLRFASTASQAGPRRYPERLLIYHAGTPRTTFLACLKVTTLFGLAFFTFLVAPAYAAAGKPLWQILGVAVCGIVPFALVAYTSAPFVVFIHLRLPPYARHPERELLRRFGRNVPASTLLDVTTMNLVGRPRLTTVAVGDLVPARRRLGVVNFVSTATAPPAPGGGGAAAPHAAATARRDAAPAARPSRFFTTSAKFPWIHLPPATQFGAPPASNNPGVHNGWIWEELMGAMERRARQ